MTTATNANVTKLYIATFDRAPDAGGLNYWVNQSGLSLEQIAQSFFDQPETQAKYAGVDLQTFVETIYRNVLGRDGEAAGVAYWKGELESGNITLDQAILAVIGGAQGTDATLLENKTEVGIYYAQNNSDKDAFAVIDEVQLNPESVSLTKKWIDGGLPAGATPSTYFVLDNSQQAYDLKGSAKDDVFVVENFKSAKVFGDEGSDTLDFQDYKTKGISVNLSTGTGPDGMTFSWVENVRGTSGNDTLIGDTNHNILVGSGGTDIIDGGAGNDRILMRTLTDVVASTVNGGANTDTLEITNQTEFSITAGDFSKVSDLEILKVGYSEEGKAAATTITMGTGATFGTIKEVHGSESYDKKGNPASDVIQSAFDLDVSGVKLVSIEELKSTADASATEGSKITIGKDTLASVKTVTGHTTKKTDLVLKAKEGDVVDLTLPTFTNIDTFTQESAIASTLIVNQSLINSLASSDGLDGFSKINAVAPAPVSTDAAASGNFGLSTLRASGIGLDLSALVDGDPNFKAIEFGTAKEVSISNINDGAAGSADLTNLKTITGSENNADMLRVKPQSKAELQDLTAITITKVERLDFEEIGVVKLNGKSLDAKTVTQISGDNDKKYGDNTDIMSKYGTHLLNGNDSPSSNALDLRGVRLESIGGLASTTLSTAAVNTGDAETKYLINSKTGWDSNFKSLNGYGDGKGVQDTVAGPYTKVTVTADDAGAYDFSSIDTAESIVLKFKDNGTPDIEYYDKFVGSAGNDVVKGGKASFAYVLGKGDDSFVGTNDANESVEGGDGNDTIALGDNNDASGWAQLIAGGELTKLVNSTAGAKFAGADSADYVQLANKAAGGLLADSTALEGAGAFADGGTGDDVITSGKGNDILLGGTGNDTLKGGDGRDTLIGGEGIDILSGGKDEDFLAGGTGDDLIEGNEGQDYIFGGKGRDILRGDQLKAGTETIEYLAKDHFIFEAGDSGETESTVDIIKDMLVKEKAIDDLFGLNDVIYLNWIQDDAALGTVNKAKAVATDNTGGANSGTTLDGKAYGSFVFDAGNTVADKSSLLDAANAALDKAYDMLKLGDVATLAADEYTSLATQFEYNGKEFMVVDAYVTQVGGKAGNNYAAANDLIVQIADSAVSWSINADDVVVTRWDIPVL